MDAIGKRGLRPLLVFSLFCPGVGVLDDCMLLSLYLMHEGAKARPRMNAISG